TARQLQVDVIGLSGLITPSLDEMVHVAREMERGGFQLPLLIGGATTSKAHTAVKIAPSYSQPVIHVLDASRAVPVVGSLISAELRTGLVEQVRSEYERVRQQHGAQQVKLVSIEEARARGPALDWQSYRPPRPDFLGVRVLTTEAGVGAIEGTIQIALSDLVPYIDWSPFFHTWELRGRYPTILDHPKHGEEARKLFADAQRLLEHLVNEKRLDAHGVYGFFPANRVGDDVEVYTDEHRTRLLTRFHFLRQQIEKRDGTPHWSLADFIAAKGEAADYLGAFAVSSGFGLDAMVQRFKAEHDDYNAIMAEALADRLAEAFAEFLHRQVRREWGFGRAENLTPADLIEEKYRGIRPAAGYPACPDHTEKRLLWELLEVERRTGIRLTENCAMWPGSSVSGLYFSHPESKYFAVGKIGRDQVLDYHRRKGKSVEEIERWLGSSLAYDPGKPRPDASPVQCACGATH
ncbi:MAG: vitamin B12 dependent-methionine synthase activation domain-containing protein, partial [Verrucomicrobiota bacterium]